MYLLSETSLMAHLHIIDASAGCGKTYFLINQIVDILLTGEDCSKILCISFTQAAAKEMHHRIYTKITQILQTNPKENIKQNLTKALIMGIKIETLHSYCQKVLQEFNLIKGELLEDTVIKIDSSLDILCKNLLQNSNSCILFNNMFVYNFKNILYQLEKNLPELQNNLNLEEYIKIIFNNLTQEGLEIVNHNYRDNLLIAPLDKLIAELHMQLNLTPNVALDFDKNLLAYIKGLAKNTPEDTEKSTQIFFYFFYFFITKNLTLRKNKNTTFTQQAKILLKAYYFFKLEQAIETSYGLINMAQAVYQIYQGDTDNYTFDFLLNKFLQLITQPEFINQQYILSQTHRHILVDEAQDLNQIQWEIIYNLSNLWFNGEENQLKSLTIVGDAKQSIYSFQGSHESLYFYFTQKLKELFYSPHSNNITTKNLNLCYRCNEPIINLINILFNKLDPCFITPPMIAANLSKCINPLVVFSLFDDTIQLYSQILSVVKKYYLKKSLMLLVKRRMLIMEELSAFLQNHGIELNNSCKINLKHYPQSREFFLWINLFFNCYNNYNCLKLLKFINIPYKILQQIALIAKQNQIYWWDVLQNYQQLNLCPQHSNIIINLLNNYKNFNHNLQNTNCTMAINHLLLNFSLNTQINNFIINKARNSNNLEQFLNHNWEIILKNSKNDFNSKNHPDCLFLNLHQAKGLEAQIVILVDANQGLVDNSKIFNLSYGHQQALLFLDNINLKKLFNTYHNINEANLKDNLKLLYVALSRAKEKIYILGAQHTNNTGSWYNLITANTPAHLLTTATPTNNKILPPTQYIINPINLILKPLVEHNIQNTTQETLYGNLMHKLIETCLKNNLNTQLNIYKQIIEAYNYTNYLQIWQEFTNLTPLLKQITSNCITLYEHPISYQNQLYRLDLISIKNREIKIYDFKTTSHCNREQFKPQMQLYYDAAKEIFKNHQINIYVVFTKFCKIKKII